MPGKYAVTPQDLEAGASKLRTTAGNIGKELAAAKTEVGRLGSDWSGEAQRQFDGLMKEWDRLAKQQQQNLDNIAKTLGSAAKAYGETESSVKSAFNV